MINKVRDRFPGRFVEERPFGDMIMQLPRRSSHHGVSIREAAQFSSSCFLIFSSNTSTVPKSFKDFMSWIVTSIAAVLSCLLLDQFVTLFSGR